MKGLGGLLFFIIYGVVMDRIIFLFYIYLNCVDLIFDWRLVSVDKEIDWVIVS